MRISTVLNGLTAGWIGSESSLRIGVTGLSRAGKTVFITSLVANLLNRGRMSQLSGVANGTIIAAYLQPQPDDTIPRFEYETHLADLTGTDPRWPQSTRTVSQLRLSLKLQPQGLLGAVSYPRVLHLDIVDYPGEWLLDLGLLDKSYQQWADSVLNTLQNRDCAQDFLNALPDANAKYDEDTAQALTRRFVSYLHAARQEGFSDCTPGRFLLPGDLEGSPALTFAPIHSPQNPKRGSLWSEMQRRFEAYKKQVVQPFFRDHFAKIDRQVVLMDALGAIHNGPQAVEDMRHAMTDVLTAFRPGAVGFLASLFGIHRVERILFAATKADHLHHSQHARLTQIVSAMLRKARDKADFSGALTTAMAIASYRATVEQSLKHQGETLDCVRGTLLETGKQAAFYAGQLPDDPAQLLNLARQGAEKWLDADYQIMNFAPAQMTLKPDQGPPHIRLDRAIDFLIGDYLT
ncbi:MAG: hypothetical protein CSA68_08625 [Rhodobacterales bacterium]|nr:MAG: hypothetical protein CSA68_08625 [Rhodobacterales bacterium]